MILFIIITIIFLIYSIFAKDWLLDYIKKRKDNPEFKYRKMKAILELYIINLFTYISGIAIVVFIVSILVVWAYPRENIDYSFNIKSLNDNIVTTGEFYCRRGSIDGELKYFFLRNTDKGKKIGHIPADKTYIEYDNDDTPHIEVYKTTHIFPEWLEKLLFVDCFNEEIVEYYRIVVPEGTISVEDTYIIDME